MCSTANSDLFSLVSDGNMGTMKVNSSLYGQQDKTFTLAVRASYKTFYATKLLPGCECANRSDVYVIINVQPEPVQVLDFGKGPFHVCE